MSRWVWEMLWRWKSLHRLAFLISANIILLITGCTLLWLLREGGKKIRSGICKMDKNINYIKFCQSLLLWVGITWSHFQLKGGQLMSWWDWCGPSFEPISLSFLRYPGSKGDAPSDCLLLTEFCHEPCSHTEASETKDTMRFYTVESPRLSCWTELVTFQVSLRTRVNV